MVLVAGGVGSAHDLTPQATISPADGTVITTAETVLSGTFGPGSGCGLGGTITVEFDPSVGTISGFLADCQEVGGDAVWSWSATWSDYGPGSHTVRATFLTQHAGFTHAGEIEATYHVQGSDDCESDSNHGLYVSCVARDTESAPGKGHTVSAAAKSK